ncbi:unnamed protein product, partial [Prorocentrum cordatum]
QVYHAVVVQLGDVLHRGTGPIMRDMNLCVHSMLVHRVKRNLAAREESPGSPWFVDMEFDEGCPCRNTSARRPAFGPRVPMPKGIRFISESAWRRPSYPAPRADAAIGEPAQNFGSDNPGPFQRGWAVFHGEQEKAASEARRKNRPAAAVPSLWRTVEARGRLFQIGAVGENGEETDDARLQGGGGVAAFRARMHRGRHGGDFFERRAHCLGAREARQTRDAAAAPEVIAHHGREGDGQAGGQIEVAALRATAGLAPPGSDA